jgi:hypothetical protein
MMKLTRNGSFHPAESPGKSASAQKQRQKPHTGSIKSLNKY